MAELADGLTYDADSLTPAQLHRAVGGMDVADYCQWFATLPADARRELEQTWGPAPGQHRLHDGRLAFSGLELGNVLIAIQPPRGYGDDPVAVYHSPNLPPAHHYLAFYRWLDEIWGADAVIHLGKHGTLEWLPGKALALSAGCWPDAALGDVPFFYPFVVNDPGEGAQAKRRTHAVVIDHLLPPMTRADTYDEMARLEQLFDEYSQLQSLDPSKLPALRNRIWETLTEAAIDRDLGLGDAPGDDGFDDLIVDVDGYLCSLKDAQIRGGLHSARASAAGRRARRPGARHHAAGPREGAVTTAGGGRGARPRPRRPAPARRRRGSLPSAHRGRGARRLAAGCGRAADRAMGLRLAGAEPGPSHRRDRQPPDRPGRALRAGRAERDPDPRRRARAAHGPQLLRARSEGAAHAALVGRGPPAGRRGDRASSTARPASTPAPSASSCGGRRCCGRRATTSRRCSPCWASDRCGRPSPGGSSAWSRSR